MNYNKGQTQGRGKHYYNGSFCKGNGSVRKQASIKKKARFWARKRRGLA